MQEQLKRQEQELASLRKLLEDYYIQVAIGQRLEDATPQDLEQYDRDMDTLQRRAEEALPHLTQSEEAS